MRKIHGHILRIVTKLNCFLADYSHKYKIRYLRKMGMRLGENVRFNCDMKAFGSEPYLISIDDDCLIAADVRFITHDGGVKVLNTLGKFNAPMDKFGGGFILAKMSTLAWVRT